MDTPVAVVGGGVMGLAAAWALGLRGVRSVVLDPLPRRTERNASNDESKVFRLAYGDRTDYPLLARASLEGWERLARDARRPLLRTTGLLLLARGPGSFAGASARAFARLGLAAPVLDGPALERAHPAFAGAGFDHAVRDPHGGMLDPPAVLESLEAEATARGARIVRGAAVQRLEEEPGQGRVACVLPMGRVRAETVVVAAGFRAPLLLPELAPCLQATRQPEFLLAPPDPAPYEAPALPVFAAFEDGFYGLPLHRGAVKVADHRKGPAVPWEPGREPPTVEEEQAVRAWLAHGLPGLADAPLARSRVCWYDNTPDDDFLLGPHPRRPRVLLAAGFSGHGFKFAPAVGEALAALASGDEPLKAWAMADPRRLLP